MIKIFSLSCLLFSISFSSYISTSPINTKPLMSYSNYSENQPMKLNHYNNDVNYPILPQKMNYTTYNNFTSSTLMNTKTLRPFYTPIR